MKSTTIFVIFIITSIFLVFLGGNSYSQQMNPLVKIQCSDWELGEYLYSSLRPEGYFPNKQKGDFTVIVQVNYTGNSNGSFGWYSGNFSSSSSSGGSELQITFYAIDEQGTCYAIADGVTRGRKNQYSTTSYSGSGYSTSSSNYKNKFEVADLIAKLNAWQPPKKISQSQPAVPTTSSSSQSSIQQVALPLAGFQGKAQVEIGKTCRLYSKEKSLIAVMKIAGIKDTMVIFDTMPVFGQAIPTDFSGLVLKFDQ